MSTQDSTCATARNSQAFSALLPCLADGELPPRGALHKPHVATWHRVSALARDAQAVKRTYRPDDTAWQHGPQCATPCATFAVKGLILGDALLCRAINS